MSIPYKLDLESHVFASSSMRLPGTYISPPNVPRSHAPRVLSYTGASLARTRTVRVCQGCRGDMYRTGTLPRPAEGVLYLASPEGAAFPTAAVR